MNQKIVFKKDCTLKSIANEITEIEVNPDYKIEEDVIDGFFVVNGGYKITASSITSENFMYKLPFQIALSEEIKRETIDLTISDLNYELNSDILHLEIELNLDYEKKEGFSVPKGIDDIDEEIIKEPKEPIKENKEIESDEEYTKYKIYIVRKEDTIESISIKYGVSIEDIIKYNSSDEIKENDKLIIPIEIDE